MAVGQRPAGRDLALHLLAWTAVMVTYLTLWSAGWGWMTYWWAWLFVLAPICLRWLTWPPAGTSAQPPDGYVRPRVRPPTSHRRRRRSDR